MKKRFLFALILSLSLLLYGCSYEVEGDRIYTVCKEANGVTYVYNGAGDFYTYDGTKVTPCYITDLQAQPMLVLRFDDDSDFNLSYIMPSVYSGTKEDCLHYVTKVLQELDGLYDLVSVDWKSFEMLISTDEYDIRVIYTNDDTVRIYANNADGGVSPPFL